MGKNLIQQRRGKGSSVFRSASFKYDIRSVYPKLNNQNIKGNIIDIIHCAMFSSPLIKINYENGDNIITIAPEGIKVGDVVEAGDNAVVRTGNIIPLKNIPEGTSIFNIEGNLGDGGKFVRTSGGSAKIVAKMKDFISVRLSSGKLRKFAPNCRACIGVAAGGGRLEKPLLKAGVAYYKYKAKNKYWPIVCGQSMNAVDHPFGKKGSHTKGKPHQASRNAPPGRKVGNIAPRRSGHKR